ncbi:MAG: response regulator [Thermoplasmatota archaeon]
MKRVLVVEDNDTNMYLISFLLERNGYQVIKATTGEDGVSRTISEQPDLVLMDIQLPGIDGHEATRRIRKSRECDDVPIVALTSYAMTGDRGKALAAGCAGYIEKPINPDIFIEQITKHMEGE